MHAAVARALIAERCEEGLDLLPGQRVQCGPEMRRIDDLAVHGVRVIGCVRECRFAAVWMAVDTWLGSGRRTRLRADAYRDTVAQADMMTVS